MQQIDLLCVCDCIQYVVLFLSLSLSLSLRNNMTVQYSRPTVTLPACSVCHCSAMALDIDLRHGACCVYCVAQLLCIVPLSCHTVTVRQSVMPFCKVVPHCHGALF